MARIFIVPDDEQAIIEIQASPLKDYILRSFAASTPEARAGALLDHPEVHPIPVQTIFAVKRIITQAIDENRVVQLAYRKRNNAALDEFSFLPEKLDTVTDTQLVVGTFTDTFEPGQLMLTRIESAVLQNEIPAS
jgi:hypothetical protein